MYPAPSLHEPTPQFERVVSLRVVWGRVLTEPMLGGSAYSKDSVRCSQALTSQPESTGPSTSAKPRDRDHPGAALGNGHLPVHRHRGVDAAVGQASTEPCARRSPATTRSCARRSSRPTAHVFATGGDGLGAVFARAGDAVAATVDAQLGSSRPSPWPEPIDPGADGCAHAVRRRSVTATTSARR